MWNRAKTVFSSFRKGKQMNKKTAVLLVACLLLAGMMNSAYAGKIESKELSQAEVDSFAQAEADSANEVAVMAGDLDEDQLIVAFAIIGIVLLAVIVIGAAT